MMSSPSTTKICGLMLKEWENSLQLTSLEKSKLSEELKTLKKQIDRLTNRHIRVTVFGKVGVGKSSLLNALVGRQHFPTDIAHGCTRKTSGVIWEESIHELDTIELVDTPGIDEIAAHASDRLSSKIALNSDLILFVLDSDITRIEITALKSLLNTGKTILLVLNRCDQWNHDQKREIIRSIKNRLPYLARNLCIETVAAAPREGTVSQDGKLRRRTKQPQISSLKERLIELLNKEGSTLLTLNVLGQAENLYCSLKSGRLERRKIEAQGIIGKFAAIKASSVAVNPFIFFDFASGLALDTALIVQLSKLYGLELKGASARKLMKRLSLHNGLIGAAQLGIQVTLGSIKNLLLIATPLTGGLSLAPAAPVAIAQAAVAVQTTKILGRLAATELLLNSHITGTTPKSILGRLYKRNPNLGKFLVYHEIIPKEKTRHINALLP